MKHKRRHLLILLPILGLFFLLTLSCTVTDSPAVKTAVAAAAQTAFEKAKELAKTQAAEMLETAEVGAKTAIAEGGEMAMTKAAELLHTAESGALTKIFSPYATSAPGETTTPQFSSPLRVSGYTTSTSSSAHTGPDAFSVDYVMSAEGADIFPILAGTIVFSGYDTDYGYVVVIRHQSDNYDAIYYSVYAHLQAGSLLHPEVDSDDGNLQVDPGQVIGRMGNTGNKSYGIVHLHLAVRTSASLQEGLVALFGASGQAAFDFRSYMTPFP